MKASHIRKLIKPIEPCYTEMFSGRVYRIGKGAVSVRNHSGEPLHTVIAVHGFLENHCYFTQAYDEPTTELILLTCSNYHIPVSGPVYETADWEKPIKYPESTIEYDAAILNQTVANLVSADHLRLHGHSRGGAVILEAMRQRPELYTKAEVVLEAPLLPQGKPHALVKAVLEPVSHGMWPWVVRLINSMPSAGYGQTFFGRMNSRKKKLLSKMFSATQDHLTIVKNIENVMAWSERNDVELLGRLNRGTILIPKVDHILDRVSMLSSAKHASSGVHVHETDATSHFITLDSKSWIPSLPGMQHAAQTA